MPQPEGTPRAFISHAHADNTLCAPYAAGLKRRLGDDAVWYDLNNNPEGHLLAAALQRELQARPALVVFVTPAALESFWVGLEIDAFLGLMAQDRARMLLPVRLAECALPPFMNAMTWIDAVGQPVDAIVERVTQALTGGRGPAPTITVAPAAPGAAPARPTAETAQAQVLLEEARAELLESHWNDAIAKLRVALSLPGVAPSADILGELALAYAGAQRWELALDAAGRGTQASRLRADLWQIQGRAHTALARDLRAKGDAKALDEARAHEREALDAYEQARGLIPRGELAARLALLAEMRATLTGAGSWAEALETVNDELALAPNTPTRLTVKLELLRRLGSDTEAVDVARALAERADAPASAWLTYARALRAAAAPEAEVRAALDAAARLTSNAASDPALAAARRELLAPPPPVIPEARFPARLARLGYTAHSRDGVEFIIPPLCPIPAGPFRLGSDKARDGDARDSETSRRTVTLAAYEIARYPVTVAEYQLFRLATKRAEPASRHNPLSWSEQLAAPDHPVVNVTWRDAFDYVAWLARRAEQPWRLPTEAEWEKAARSDPRDPLGASSERIYPWGDTFDASRCNSQESGLGATSPVGWYSASEENQRAGRQSGASPCGAEDMAGNVWEWTASVYAQDYGKSNQVVGVDNTESRINRGGSWVSDRRGVRAAYRLSVGGPDFARSVLGFRHVRASPGS